MSDASEHYYVGEEPACQDDAVDIESLTNTFETLNLCLSPRQAHLIIEGFEQAMSTWSRRQFRRFGLNQNQSRKGASGVIDRIGLRAAAISNDMDICSVCLA